MKQLIASLILFTVNLLHGQEVRPMNDGIHHSYLHILVFLSRIHRF